MGDKVVVLGPLAQHRLREESIVWLTTVGSRGIPQPRPVWFLWDGSASLLIYSQPNKPKLRNIAENPQVALSFDGDGQGGNIVVLQGEAQIDLTAPAAADVPAFLEKYRQHISRIGMAPDSFAEGYSVPIRVTLTKVQVSH